MRCPACRSKSRRNASLAKRASRDTPAGILDWERVSWGLPYGRLTWMYQNLLRRGLAEVWTSIKAGYEAGWGRPFVKDTACDYLFIKTMFQIIGGFNNHDDKAIGVASGFNDLELGLRLRYEIVREFAPYVGIHWERKLGNTADLARDDDEDVDVLSFVTGVRIFF